MLELLLLLLLGVASLLYLYLCHCYSYWQSKGVVQPPVTLGFGHFRDMFLGSGDLGQIYFDIYKSYPNNDAVGLYDLTTPKLFVRNPELIRRVMVSDFSSFHDNAFSVKKELDPYFSANPFCLRGEDWKTGRNRLLTSLTVNKTKELFPLMKEILTRLDSYVIENLGKDFEAKELATLFTMDNVSSCVFGINSNCFTDAEAPFKKVADLMMKDQLVTWWKTVFMLILPKLRNFLGFRVVPAAVNHFVEKMVEVVVNHRVKNNVYRNDVMQHLMKKHTGSDFKEIVGHGMTFFIDGFESSSMTAGTILYELAVNPQIQQTLHEELKNTFGEVFDPDYDTLHDLPYLHKVILESQRKHPVSYVFMRLCTKDIELYIDGKPVNIDSGTEVVIPAYSIHVDPKYYPNPMVFDSERFNEENKDSRPPCTYMPFGEGPRMCPGNRFALAQLKLFVANMIYKYKIFCTEKTPKTLTFTAGTFGFVLNEQNWIGIEPRK